MSTRVTWALIAAALVLGLAFRLARLDARPMHHDEANQAVKFGMLLEAGEYRYDREDHHGPTLYYLTLPSAWLRGQHTLASLDETTLRAVPAVFGAALILLLGLLARPLGGGAAAWAALLAAVSPALTYYSRFYIQEAVFACFALAFVMALGRWGEERTTGWAVAVGLVAGLLVATKETWLIVVPAAMAAMVMSRRGRLSASTETSPRASESADPQHMSASTEVSPRGPKRLRTTAVGASLCAGLFTAAVVIFLFYSSFFSNPRGPLDWLLSMPVYGARGVGGGTHAHPWFYYLQLLSFSKAGGVRWSEGLVVGLALCGAVDAFSRRGGFWPRYLCLYAAITCVVFSALPYKTPWNLLPFYAAFVAVAGYGASRLVAVARPRALKALLAVALAAGAAQLGAQAWRANFRYPADPRNPYVYAHTTSDFLRLVRRLADLSSVAPEGRAMLVEVIAGPYEQWPLPWYLRSMSRVGYWPKVDDGVPLGRAAVIVASEEQSPGVDTRVDDRYVSEFYGLRPGVLLTLYIERGLWEKFLSSRHR